eukprot:3125863-Amphidinium_carterae.2
MEVALVRYYDTSKKRRAKCGEPVGIELPALSKAHTLLMLLASSSSSIKRAPHGQSYCHTPSVSFITDPTNPTHRVTSIQCYRNLFGLS